MAIAKNVLLLLLNRHYGRPIAEHLLAMTLLFTTEHREQKLIRWGAYAESVADAAKTLTCLYHGWLSN